MHKKCFYIFDILLNGNPVGLELQQRCDAGGTVHYGVFSLRSLIPRGTKFGPFRGRLVNEESSDNSFTWEVCTDTCLDFVVYLNRN